MVFVQKWPFFPNFFLGNISQENVFYDIKKKFQKKAIFGENPWVNPFKKKSIFRLFEPFVFIA